MMDIDFTDRLIPVSDRGLAYGDGLFETLRIIDGKVILQKLHWQRLRTGCEKLQIIIKWSNLAQQIQQFLQKNNFLNGILKIIVTRGSGGRGYRPDNNCRTIIQKFAVPNYPNSYYQGIELYLCKTRLAIQPRLAGIKHLNRLEQVLASNEFDESYAEGLMLDTQGRIIEGISSNIFMVSEGRLLTPDLQNSGVAGVMRQWIMQHYPVVIKNIYMDILSNVDEIFICNSIRGIWPVTKLDNYNWNLGQITQNLQKKIYNLMHIGLG